MSAASDARIAAAQRGQVTFSTGTPCRRGHLAPRYVLSGQCTICKKNENAAYTARWRGLLERARADGVANH